MGKITHPKHHSSIVSSQAKPSTSLTAASSKSSLLKSSFCPSRYQLSLFASVIRGLDAEHVRIHNTRTGRVQCNHTLSPHASLTTLEWGYYSPQLGALSSQQGSKKRKRTRRGLPAPSPAHVALAFGTSASEIHIYSPSEGQVLATLKDAHTHGIRDFKFEDDGAEGLAWSIGGDAKLIQWDIATATPLRTIPLPSGSVQSLAILDSTLLCASHEVYAIDTTSGNSIGSFTASTNPVHLIIKQHGQNSTASRFLTAARHDRFLSLFESNGGPAVGSLRTESEVLTAELASLETHSPASDTKEGHRGTSTDHHDILAIINRNGSLELFVEPFRLDRGSVQEETKNLKARMQQRNRKSDTQVQFIGAAQHTPIALVNAAFDGNHITVAWVYGGVHVAFEPVVWRDASDGTLLLKGNVAHEVAKSNIGLQPAVNGDTRMLHAQLDESHTVVTNGAAISPLPAQEATSEVISISSGDDLSDSSDEEADPVPRPSTNATSLHDSHGNTDRGTEMTSTGALRNGMLGNRDLSEEQGGPSFGDLLKANAPEPVEVVDVPTDTAARSLIPVANFAHPDLPSGMSLGTVLTQSLRTNDSDLLRNCFRIKELSIVRATIERLDSAFVPLLLQRLAERLHSHPGRAGSLMVWVQWTLISHGGYLASRPDVMKDLSSLHRVVQDRSESLQPLLSLKGKLDMLEAQMSLRKAMQRRPQAGDIDEEEDVVYVEGQEESASDIDGDESDTAINGKDSFPSYDMNMEPKSEMPLVNGHISDSEDDSDADDNGIFNNEASSSEAESEEDISEENVNHEDVDTDTSEAEDTPPPKRSASTKVKAGRGQ